MSVSNEEIRQRLGLGEDNYWEFKRFEFKGSSPTSPKRDELADDMIAFANSRGGKLLCGVTGDRQIQGMAKYQLKAVNQLLVDVSSDLIEPALRIIVQHRKLDGKAFVLVEVPRGDSVHERSGIAFIRIDRTKRSMSSEERARLSQSRAQYNRLWF